MTYDMGLQYEGFTADGMFGGMGDFLTWPLYKIRRSGDMLKDWAYVRKITYPKEESWGGKESRTREEWTKERNAFKKFYNELADDIKYFFILSSWNEFHYFDNEDAAKNAFVDFYGISSGDGWDNASEDDIEHAFEYGEENGWTMPIIGLNCD